MTTLILLFHRDLSRSRANAALKGTAETLAGVEVADMAKLYPNGIDMAADAEREAARLIAADSLVLQFPMQWYSTPALLKTWQDTVLTRMGYIHPDTEGRHLAGKPIMVAATMGAEETTYRPQGRNRVSVPELLLPLRITANRFDMDWRDPFLLHGVDRLDEDALRAAARGYRMALERFAAGAVTKEVADSLR